VHELSIDLKHTLDYPGKLAAGDLATGRTRHDRYIIRSAGLFATSGLSAGHNLEVKPDVENNKRPWIQYYEGRL